MHRNRLRVRRRFVGGLVGVLCLWSMHATSVNAQESKDVVVENVEAPDNAPNLEQRVSNGMGLPVVVRFTEAPIQKIVRSLREMTRLPFYLDKKGLELAGLTLNSKIDLDLEGEVSLQSALNLLMNPQGLALSVHDNKAWITSDTVKRRSLPPPKPTSDEWIASSEVRMFRLRYVKVEPLKNVVLRKFPKKFVYIAMDERPNILIVRGHAKELALVKDFVAQTDNQKAKGLELQSTGSKSLSNKPSRPAKR